MKNPEKGHRPDEPQSRGADQEAQPRARRDETTDREDPGERVRARLTEQLGRSSGLEEQPTSGIQEWRPPEQGRVDRRFWKLFEQYGPGWTGADSTYSVELPDGRTAWLFSDTFLGRVNPDRSRPRDVPYIHNSIVVQDGDELTTLHGGTPDDPQSLFTPGDGSSWSWTYDGVVEGDALRVFLVNYDGTKWEWRLSGNDIATLSLPGLEVQQFTPVEANNGVAYGAYLLRDGDHTYVYGLQDLGKSNKLGHVAKAPRDRVLAQDQWQFFTGDGWSSDPADTAPMLAESIANEYSVTPTRDGYVLITVDTSGPRKEWGEIVAYHSPNPEGPWTGRTVIYEAPETADPVLGVYNAHAHPQFTTDGKLLVSYNVNAEDPQFLYEDADAYRARFIRVHLPGL